jgi:hypothetical protein
LLSADAHKSRWPLPPPHTPPDNCAVYDCPANCWFILFSENPFPMRLQSSRFVAILKSAGEIVRDDLANDEG